MKNIIFLLAIPIFLVGCGGKNPSPTVTYHTITFHSDGENEIPSQHVIDGELAVEPKEPSKEYLYFAGWYTDESLEINYYFSFDTVIKQDYDLYARWVTDEEICHITLNCDYKLVLEREHYVLDIPNDYKSRIYLKSQLKNKYDLPYLKPYYKVEVDEEEIDDFIIERVDTGDDYYVNITIPKDKLGSEIIITTRPYYHYLTFTGVEDNATIYYSKKPSLDEVKIQCTDSLDAPNWEDWNPDDTKTLNKNQTLYVKNIGGTPYVNSGLINFFTENAKIASDGNVMSLLNFNNLYDDCFHGLFNGCTSLVSPPILPATTLTKSCYASMFNRCGNLLFAPILPATVLDEACCSGMFYECSSLKINNESGIKFFTCPDTTPFACVQTMFSNTGGDYTADPVEGESYYYTLD